MNKNTSDNQKDNIFSQHFAMLEQKPTIKINIDDPLITALEIVIDEQLGHVKLNKDEILSVIKVVNDEDLKDWWRVGWRVKCDMLAKWY